MDQQQLDTILKGLQKGDARCQGVFYRYCHGELMKVALRYHASAADASASFNRAMLQVFTRIADYRREGAVLGWVRRILVNTCLNDLRDGLRFRSTELADGAEESFSVAAEAYSRIESKALLEMVQALPATTRTVFNLYVLEGLTHEQIATLLRIPQGTSKWHLHGARTFLKEQLLQRQAHETHLLQK